jgi:hypothetical protein
MGREVCIYAGQTKASTSFPGRAVGLEQFESRLSTTRTSTRSVRNFWGPRPFGVLPSGHRKIDGMRNLSRQAMVSER